MAELYEANPHPSPDHPNPSPNPSPSPSPNPSPNPNQAAELYEGIDAHREAIHVYMAGGMWEQAPCYPRTMAHAYSYHAWPTPTLTMADAYSYHGLRSARPPLSMAACGSMWEQARQLCRSAAPQYAREVEEAHKQHLAKSGAAAELVQGGDVHAGIETYAQRNDWEAALQLANQQAPTYLPIPTTYER